MKFSIKDSFSKCDQIRRKLRIWSHLLKKSLMENFIFCALLRFWVTINQLLIGIKFPMQQQCYISRKEGIPNHITNLRQVISLFVGSTIFINQSNTKTEKLLFLLFLGH